MFVTNGILSFKLLGNCIDNFSQQITMSSNSSITACSYVLLCVTCHTESCDQFVYVMAKMTKMIRMFI